MPFELNEVENEELLCAATMALLSGRPGIQMGPDHEAATHALGAVTGRISVALPPVKVFVGAHEADISKGLAADIRFKGQPAYITVGPGFSRFFKPREQRALMAHELGHIFHSHRRQEDLSQEGHHKREFEADQFAKDYGFGEDLADALQTGREKHVAPPGYEKYGPDHASDTHPALNERLKRLRSK